MLNARNLILRTGGRHLRTFSSSAQTRFDLELNQFEIGTQVISAGKTALPPFLDHVKSYSKRPLIVTDAGLVKLGLLEPVLDGLKASGLTPTIFDETQPNPGIPDVQGIAQAFLAGDCDAIIGYGGGGPLDAAKGGAALVGAKRVDSNFSIENDSGHFTENIRSFFGQLSANDPWLSAVPAIAAIPTTSGTGSEGGKSAVITDTKGVKQVFGHPVFMPASVALVPQFTATMPLHLTAATGIDAMFHCMEAFFVTRQDAYEDGMNDAEIAVTDDYGLRGIEMILAHLPAVCQDGSDLSHRLHMQVAALYGAKAFRKAALGGVHATAHAVGAHYHLHHGAAISRMALPVLTYTLERASEETKHAYGQVNDLLHGAGHKGPSLLEAYESFIQPFGFERGLSSLPVTEADIDTLSTLSSNDPCQTNPVCLSRPDYEAIFRASS